MDQDDYDKQIQEMMQMIQALSSGKPVEVRAPTPKGPKISEEDVAKWNKAAEMATKNENDISKMQKDVDELNRMKESVRLMGEKLEQCVL